MIAIAFCIAITWKSEARCAPPSEIYSTLTSDTIPVKKKDTSVPRLKSDSSSLRDSTHFKDSSFIDSIPPTQRVDTFHLRFSKDSLDAPVEYEAADSGVLLVKEKKFLLYGKTKTVYKKNTLTAPRLILDQATNIVTAMRTRDSIIGTTLVRARFTDGQQTFESDTIQFDFKTQKGLTTNTFTKQDELYINGESIKKVNETTTFIKRLTMTTCDYDDPHFGFVANKGKFINDKIAVTGPIHPEFEGVPLPIYLPFGIFPLKKGRHSGLLAPQFAVTEDYGIGLEGLGYYQVLNDYYDVTLRTNIYSYGGWSANIIPTYRKRYKYQGSLSFNIQHTKQNFKGDPDYSLVKTFNIAWTHSVDSRAKPGTNFSANVNAGSTRFNEFVTNDPQRNLNNTLNSSIAYSKTWQGKPYNLTLSANHNQNNQTHQISVMLPDAGFTVTTLYPLQRKNPIGAPKWYEKIGVGYQGAARSQVVFVDTMKNSFKSILDTVEWGAQHRFPISTSLPPLGPLIASPFISYEETWLTARQGHEWDSVKNKIDTIYDKKGLFIDRQLSFGISVNTAVYGTFNIKNSRIKAIRHVMRPSVNFNYKPNLSKKYYDYIQIDSTKKRYDHVPQIPYGRNLYSGYGYGTFGGLTFQLDNNLEMKMRKKKDTTGKDTKVRLIDGFGFSSGYNFLQDSLKLQPFNLYFRTTLFEKLSISAQGVYNFYRQDSFGRYINSFKWQSTGFNAPGLNSISVSMSTSFQSKPRDEKKAPASTPIRQITDPTLAADEQRLRDYKLHNPQEFVDFNIPWSISLSFSLFLNNQWESYGKYKKMISSSMSFNNSFSLTPKWNFTTNGYFDFNTMQLTMFTMSISRDMHCWQLAVNVTPIGNYHTFNFSISPKSGILQDLKVNRSRTFQNY